MNFQPVFIKILYHFSAGVDIITFAIILTSFLTFCYFFFNYIEEKAAEYKLQQEAEAKKLDKTE
ncbi:MAG: hypothetical protein LN546_05765 [Rickettsia endosymbiont of Ecitomorpha arachnoides]|nr:hypothetical protein [Rickettsia endosymbiont of Ecitomorpha arachnoides]